MKIDVNKIEKLIQREEQGESRNNALLKSLKDKKKTFNKTVKK